VVLITTLSPSLLLLAHMQTTSVTNEPDALKQSGLGLGAASAAWSHRLSRPHVSANSVKSHLVPVTKALTPKTFMTAGTKYNSLPTFDSVNPVDLL